MKKGKSQYAPEGGTAENDSDPQPPGGLAIQEIHHRGGHRILLRPAFLPAQGDGDGRSAGMPLTVYPLHVKLASIAAQAKHHQKKRAKLRLVLAIATTGRPAILSQTLRDLARQDRAPDLLVLSVAGPEDYDSAVVEALPLPCLVVNGPRGLCAQRNRALEVLRGEDLLMLMDDDFLMAPDYLAQVERLFARHPDVAMATGQVLADGIRGPGFDIEEGRARLGTSLGVETAEPEEAYNGYGCNMALRARPICATRLRFDERLPLYGWLEDVDFSRRLAAHGRIVRSATMTGVHLGTKTGRQSGLRLGYSQIANPLYLIRKGTMAPRRAYRLMARNLAANLLHAPRPEPWVDRRGRLKGNLLAILDLIRGRMEPERVLQLG